jgi:TolB-like protein/DNA-binding winged helix-turn-helix (wHTH) protein
MEMPTPSSLRFRFSGFELNPRTGELVREGQHAQLQEKSLQLLLALLERPGELLSREELTGKLWPAGTFVDFDRGLNKAVNKLREVLRDSADHPQFIETLPRKGYRFVGTVTKDDPSEKTPPTDVPVPAPPLRRWRYALSTGVVIAALGVVAGTNVAGWRNAIASRLRPSHVQIASLAVLPLENLSGDSQQAYFADGMTDALITEVARTGATRVISRTTALRYKGTQKTLQQIGRELNVDAVVEGTVLRSGDSVRITAQLIQISTDNHLWAASYEGDVRNVLRLQQDVATDIARRIGSLVKLVEPVRTVNPVGYGEYLKGRFYFFQYTPEGWQKAIEHYTLATQADGNFAPAFAGLAQSYLVARGWNAFPPDEALRNGKAAALKALRLDATLSSSHLAMGAVHAQEWDPVDAEKEFSRGLELNPNDPLAWQQHGNQLLSQGQFERAIAEQERARRLDPLSPIINANLARAYYYSRQYDNAIVQARETLRLEPKYPAALRYLEAAYRHKGMVAEAVAARLAGAKPEQVATLEHAYKSSGYPAILLLDAETYRRSGVLIEAARAYAQIGDKEQAWASLEECYRRHGPGLERLKVDPDFDPIRSDPRYKDLLRRVGYAE